MKALRPKNIDYLTKKHPQFAKILKDYGLPPDVSRSPGFETLARIILEQQVSLESANACYRKLSASLKSFTPKNILSLDDAQYKKCGVSRPKIKYLKALATTIKNKQLNLKELPAKTVEEVLEALIQVKGIGPWTAQVYLMFALQHEDIYPPGDIALIKTIKELWEVEEKEEIASVVETYQPYRSTACFLLWHHYLSKRGRKSPV